MATFDRRYWIWLVVSFLLIGVAFMIGGSVNNMAQGANTSGTSIPIAKGGTGATTPAAALQNLGIPDWTGQSDKCLSNNGTTLNWATCTESTSSGDNLINRPDLWTVGTEYDFGDGLYGQRFTGTDTLTSTSNGQPITLLSTNGKLFMSGGYVKKIGGTSWADTEYDANSTNFTQSGHALFFTSAIVNQVGNIRIFWWCTEANTKISYDVWVKYTK